MLHWVSARHQKQRQRTWTRRKSVRSWKNSMRRRHSSSIHSMITLSIMSCDVSKKNAPTRRSCRAAIVIRLLLIELVLRLKVFDSVLIALQTSKNSIQFSFLHIAPFWQRGKNWKGKILFFTLLYFHIVLCHSRMNHSITEEFDIIIQLTITTTSSFLT